jgi:hypothetical protein
MALTNFYKKIRGLIQDDLVPGDDYFEFVSYRSFTLSMSTIVASSLKVYINGQEQVNTSGNIIYTFDEDTSKITFEDGSGIISAGDVIECHYQGYTRYTNFEIRGYILSSIIRLSTYQYQTFVLREDDTIFPTPIETDENLICFVASILMEGNIATYSTSEIHITFGKEEDIEVRFRKLMALWKKSYGVMDYIKLRYVYKPLDGTNGNLGQ